MANSLAKKVAEVTGQPSGRSYFLNIKGPELLNKYVGETERQIRLIFQRAKEKSNEGVPVIVFDEMDSIFRTCGSGVSPPGRREHHRAPAAERSTGSSSSRTDRGSAPPTARTWTIRRSCGSAAWTVLIKIERPTAARLATSSPSICWPPASVEDVEAGGDREAALARIIDEGAKRMYSDADENRFLEVTYANGDKEVLYFKDFTRAIENIVNRAGQDGHQAGSWRPARRASRRPTCSPP